MYAGHFDFSRPLVSTIEHLWTPDECAALLQRVAAAEWLRATINAASGRVVSEKLRNNDLAIVRDEDLATTILERARPHLPETMTAEGRVVALSGLFQPLRIYRYQPGQRFGLHNDQSYLRADGARSLLTFMLYLDDDFDGGETDFPEQSVRITPRTGDALWFQHMVLHAGLEVTRGVKHALRTDVLYCART